MSIDVNKSEDGRELTIVVGEKFDFGQHKDFREAYRNEPPTLRYRVDLSRARYLDSSALGMLLLLKKHAGGESAQVRLEGANDDVRKILEIANFHRIFVMT